MFISRQGQQTFMWSREARQATYVSRNTEARLRNHFCTGKAINITYCECVFVALGTHGPYYSVICGLFDSALSSNIIS